jgi:hypothetical protein
MNGWTSNVEAPFDTDPRFWTSVGRSADALWTLVIATVLVALLGRYAAAAFVVPVVLLAISGRDARASSAHTRASFGNRQEWRAAERQAVAAALPGALVRHLRPRGAG